MGLGQAIRKIPGFRSGSKIKAFVALIIGFFVLFIILISTITVPPTLALDEIKPTNKSSISVSGETRMGKPVYLLQNNEVVQSIKADSKGKFFFGLNDLEEGNFTYTVQACNSEKKEHCREENVLITIDKTPPIKPTIALPEELPEKEDGEITIAGATDPKSKVIVKAGDKELPETYADEKGGFEIKTGLVLGANTFSILAADEAGNESEPIISIIKFTPTKFKAKVTQVIDGDTIQIEDGQKVRYIGIDTPETVHPSEPVQCFGKQASEKNKELVGGKIVYLEKDVSETDKYGRLLRYVWVGDIFVNDYLVRQGYAQSSTYPPDVKYQDQFLQAQREARENNRGLWGSCSYFGEPEAQATPKATATPTPKTGQQAPPPTSPSSSSQPGTYSCSGNLYNCSDFSYWEDAQYVFEQCGGAGNDVHGLDGDKDGVACESLPKRGGGSTQPAPQTSQPTSPPSSGGGGYTCNCSKTCGQMSSCEEAYFQLNTCGCSARDGDKDGVPCESICQ